MTTIDTATLEAESHVTESPPDMTSPNYSSANYSSRNISSRAGASVFQFIPISQIGPSPYNTRDDFDEEQMEALTQSIGVYGVLEPVLVQDNADVPDADAFTDSPTRFRLIAGERRWRAAQRAGLEQIPCVIRKVTSDLEAAEMTVSENFQRDDFSPIGEARAFQLLIRLGKKQSEIAALAGRTQGAISKALGLNELPETVQGLISKRLLTASHGHLLHSIFVKGPSEFGGNEDEIMILADTMVREKWTVSQLEQELKVRFPKAAAPTLDLDVSPVGDQLFAGPHPQTAAAPAEALHPTQNIDAQEEILDATFRDESASPESPSNATGSTAEVLGSHDPVTSLPAQPENTTPVPDAGRSEALLAEGTAPTSSEEAVFSHLPQSPQPASSIGDHGDSQAEDTPQESSIDEVVSNGHQEGASGFPADAVKPDLNPSSLNPSSASAAPASAKATSAQPKAEPAKPVPAAPATPSLPPGWTNAPIKIADYEKARDLGLWPPAFAIEAVQELKDQLATLSDPSSSNSTLSDPNAVTLHPVACQAAKMMAQWNLADAILGPEQTAILHALYPNREETTYPMIVSVLTVSWCRRSRVNGAGEGAEMPPELAQALADMTAAMST